MNSDAIAGLLAFLGTAGRLKDTLRNGRSPMGRPESTAEHTWRLCLFALLVSEAEPGLDATKLLRLCLVHDLAEALTGDIPAPVQQGKATKSAEERAALIRMVAPLPVSLGAGILALWEEYEAASTREAHFAKGLDKLETLLTHAEGVNPPGFDLAWNLGYGRVETAADPLLEALREALDAMTRARLAADINPPGTS